MKIVNPGDLVVIADTVTPPGAGWTHIPDRGIWWRIAHQADTVADGFTVLGRVGHSTEEN